MTLYYKKYIKFYDERRKEFEDMNVESFSDLTRAYVKIQDGCNNYCAYCIIPYVRGSIRSKKFDEAVQEIKTLVSKGHKEIVFTGINTGAYGKETGLYDLTDLIREISKIDDLERIRVSSIEITEIDDKFIEEMRVNPKLCAHLHVSLQSGSERVLQIMNRKYTKEQYLNLIEKIKNDDVVNITLFYGKDIKQEEAESLQAELSTKYPECDITLLSGGQPVYYYIISLE